ncbi:related to Hsk1-interacting molecule 1 [Sporisorium scitamineum]|uniref:Related to Hsk1-interacting molecule 1 n=1 Tax=Sporisorium scitamineum TaxID=49012 RepID=A0A0F7RUX3_9BASI|nr:hypothetical protein [Sporisorium scitamineum]CDU25678.1 related to Hsk1-interacting molecule 1 [Sporisorium scitamineum]
MRNEAEPCRAQVQLEFLAVQNATQLPSNHGDSDNDDQRWHYVVRRVFFLAMIDVERPMPSVTGFRYLRENETEKCLAPPPPLKPRQDRQAPGTPPLSIL